MSENFGLTECVECGSTEFRTARKDITVKRPNPGPVTASGQKCIECVKCGELYFDEEQAAAVAKILDKKAHEEPV